jgi:hypothetical protein
MYATQQFCTEEIADLSTHLARLQEMIAFYHQQERQGRKPDPEPILKLMNVLVDLYS